MTNLPIFKIECKSESKQKRIVGNQMVTDMNSEMIAKSGIDELLKFIGYKEVRLPNGVRYKAPAGKKVPYAGIQIIAVVNRKNEEFQGEVAINNERQEMTGTELAKYYNDIINEKVQTKPRDPRDTELEALKKQMAEMANQMNAMMVAPKSIKSEEVEEPKQEHYMKVVSRIKDATIEEVEAIVEEEKADGTPRASIIKAAEKRIEELKTV